MSDRLTELRRQRALVQEHLAWLDREIAEASGADSSAGPVFPPSSAASDVPPPAAAVVVAAALKARAAVPAVSATTPTPVPESPAVAAAADAILDEYRVAPDALKTDVKKGCFLYFALALVLVAAVVVAMYFALRHDR